LNVTPTEELPMKRLTTTIDADMFESSAVGLERQLARRTGIGHVEVDAATHTVTVDFDATRVKPAEVQRFIAESGYRGYVHP
jgi:copper chaperone CopZ